MGCSVIAFPAFFITLCYHTIYAAPWIFPPIAFYAFDIVVRRIKDAQLIRVDGGMNNGVLTPSYVTYTVFLLKYINHTLHQHDVCCVFDNSRVFLQVLKPTDRNDAAFIAYDAR